MLRVVKLSIRFVLYRSADDGNDDDNDDALKLSCSADVSLLPSLLFRATREKLSNSRERMYGSVTSEAGNGQWWAHAQWCESFETGAMRALLQAERPLRRCAALSLSLSLSSCVCLSLEEIVRRNLCQSGKIRVLHELYKQP